MLIKLVEGKEERGEDGMKGKVKKKRKREEMCVRRKNDGSISGNDNHDFFLTTALVASRLVLSLSLGRQLCLLEGKVQSSLERGR